MFGDYQNGSLQKIKLSFGMHWQLINMDLQESMVIKDM
jgi:hypothetical protein